MKITLVSGGVSLKKSFARIAVLLVVVIGVLYLFLWEPKNTADYPGKRLVILNWEDYLDTGVVADFEKETGISVSVMEYRTVDESLTLIQNNLAAYDLLIVNDSILEFLQQSGLIQPFDIQNIKGRERLDENFSRYLPVGIPYLWSATGFIVDRRQVPDEVDSVTILWDPRYRGKIRLLDDVREALFPVMVKERMDINESDPAQIASLEPLVTALRENNVFFGDTFDNIEKLLEGKAWIVQTYNGDYLYKVNGKPEYRFFLPREGFPATMDIFVFPKSSQNPVAAHRFVSFYLRPEIAARTTNRYCYANPVRGSEVFLRDDLRGNAVMFPPADVRARAASYREVKDAFSVYQRLFYLMRRTEH